LEDLREMKYKRDQNGEKLNVDSEKKYQGIVLENYKNTLIEVDKIHMKAIIELKSVQNKVNKLKKFTNSAN
jgi:hypothetical protein